MIKGKKITCYKSRLNEYRASIAQLPEKCKDTFEKGDKIDKEA